MRLFQGLSGLLLLKTQNEAVFVYSANHVSVDEVKGSVKHFFRVVSRLDNALMMPESRASL
jgi:hypothetical protein